MSLPRAISWVCLSCLVLVAAASCSSQKDTEAYVPSQRGAVQPDAGGALLTEADACAQLKLAESSARSHLGCPAAARTCPDSIRPAGGADCYQYSRPSIDGCDALFATFTSCADFETHPCLITAVDQCDVPPDGEGGAGGAPSTPSEAGSAGEPSESTAGAGGA